MSYYETTAPGAAFLYPRSGSSVSPDIPWPALCIYRDERLYSLPLPPSLYLSKCQIISLGHKIYVLGGEENAYIELASQEVWALDLVESVWSRCADMNWGRMSFGIAALDGKIYVFGGSNCGEPVRECEVYDPTVNAWSRIADMLESRTDHQVAVLGNLFILYGGLLYETNDVSSIRYWPSTGLIYHQEQDEWVIRYEVGGVEQSPFCDSMFMVHRCCYRFISDGQGDHIQTYDIFTRSWMHLHDIHIHPDLDLGLWGWVTMVGDEILTAGHLGSNTNAPIACLLRTNGFRSSQRVILLEIVQVFHGKFEQEFTILFPLDW